MSLGQKCRWRLMVVVSVVAPLAAGCGGHSQGSAGRSATANIIGTQKDGAPSDACSPKGKRQIRLDVNDDKEPDIWKLYVTSVVDGTKVEILRCKERDLNFDGRVDTWYEYDDSGNVVTERVDMDFDGLVDMVTYRRGNKVLRKELDANHDGKADVWKYYEDGTLARIERDTNYDGRVDYWQYYEGGQLDRIGYDQNNDGRVDRWDRAPAPTDNHASGSDDSTPSR